jgi:hypothetical protein
VLWRIGVDARTLSGGMGDLRRPARLCFAPAIFLICAPACFARSIAPTAAQYQSCAQLNARYPHGVGLVEARDRTNGTPPVTTFVRSDKLYAQAMAANKTLDSDHDGIACEQS